MEKPAKRNLFDDDSDGDDYNPGGLGNNTEPKQEQTQETTQPEQTVEAEYNYDQNQN